MPRNADNHDKSTRVRPMVSDRAQRTSPAPTLSRRPRRPRLSDSPAMIRNRTTELRMVRASDLVPNPGNWRRHPKAQADALHGLLFEIGYADVLLARETPQGLMLIDGHLRAETTPDQDVPVLVLDVTEAEADKLLATLDPLAALAERNDEAVRALLERVETDSEAVRAMLRDLVPELVRPEGFNVEEAMAAAPDLVSRVEPGEVWRLGRHRLMCGDSTRAVDVARLLGGASPVLMVTDPPYGVEYEANWRNKVLPRANRRIGKVTHDDRIDWAAAWKLFAGDVIYCWHAGIHAGLVQASLAHAGFEIRYQLIWSKPHFVISCGHYHARHEPCFCAVRAGAQAHWVGGHNETTVREIRLDRNVAGGHSAQKPIECIAFAIRNHEGDVYDPFLGSGTTLIASDQLNRVCYGMEIEPKYCEVIIARWESYTGSQAVREEP